MTDAQYEAQTDAIQSDFNTSRRAAPAMAARNEWRYAYLEAVRAGVVILCDIRTRQMVTPWRG